MIKFYNLKQDFLKFTGNDRLDFLNRMSTNRVDNLAKNKRLKTILTTYKGRFIDLLILYNFGDFIFASCSFGKSGYILTHLDKYTIMDDFKIHNMAGTHATIHLMGSESDKLINEILGIDPASLKNNDFSVFVSDGRHSIITHNDDSFGGYYFICNIKDTDYFMQVFFKSGLLFEELSDSAYNVMRIRLGIPKSGDEITEDTNPLECGLNKYVSFTKGCYIGQEVIARLDSYDRVSKHLIGIKSESGFSKGDKITLDNYECGYVTSYAKSDKYGYIGLGFVKTPFIDFDKNYGILTSNNYIECKIINLPFS
jgi:folate-binding protein YgfZ